MEETRTDAHFLVGKYAYAFFPSFDFSRQRLKEEQLTFYEIKAHKAWGLLSVLIIFSTCLEYKRRGLASVGHKALTVEVCHFLFCFDGT